MTSPPLKFHVSVTALIIMQRNYLIPYLSSPLDYVLSLGRYCVLFIYIPGIWYTFQHRADAQVRVKLMTAWARGVAGRVVRTGQFLNTFLKVKPNEFLMGWMWSMQARVE